LNITQPHENQDLLNKHLGNSPPDIKDLEVIKELTFAAKPPQ
jgi:hypothetical protein